MEDQIKTAECDDNDVLGVAIDAAALSLLEAIKRAADDENGGEAMSFAHALHTLQQVSHARP